jgi:anti-sigma B factor antagonist
MQNADARMDVRQAAGSTFVIDIRGDLTSAGEGTLSEAYGRANELGAETIILNFSGLDYMNSSGIGLLVTLLIRTRRKQQRLLTCGLTDHYKQIFEITRLSDAISIYDSETDALQAAAGAT